MKTKRIIFTWLIFLCLGSVLILAYSLNVSSLPTRSLASIDSIRIEKSKGVLSTYHDSKLVKQYKISLGSDPQGHKTCAGDGKTPEGLYSISAKNPQSRYHLSLKISYPNPKDRESAKARGVSPGGDIMIHGLPKAFSWVGGFHTFWNWTKGCVAVTNEEIEEIFAATPIGTQIEIKP